MTVVLETERGAIWHPHGGWWPVICPLLDLCVSTWLQGHNVSSTCIGWSLLRSLFKICTAASAAPFLSENWLEEFYTSTLSLRLCFSAASSGPALVCLSKNLYRSSTTGFAPMTLVPASDHIFHRHPLTDVLIGHQKTFCQLGIYQFSEDSSTGSLWSSHQLGVPCCQPACL